MATADDDRVLSADEMRAMVRERGDAGLREVLKTYGALSARLTVLGIAMQDRQGAPVVRNYPPRVFIAYKWADQQHQDWVRDLATEVARRGYDVLLDRDHLAQDASNFDEVPKYIARLVSADVCLVVVTQAYLDLVEVRHHQTSWVFDEYEAAAMLAHLGRLRICPVWKDPAARPEKLGLRVNVIDARRLPFDPAVLDRELPVYTGPVLDDDGRARLLDFVVRADELVGADPPALEELRDWLVEHSDLAALYDYQVRLSRLYWLAGYLQEAHATALAILDDCRDPDQAMALAQALDTAGDHPAMFRFLYRARQRRYLRDSAPLHYFLGETLHERGSLVAAGNHFGWLLRSPGFDAFPAQLQDEIRERRATAQAADTSDVADSLDAPDSSSGGSFVCDTCGSAYHLADPHDQVCGECATLHRAAHCPVCDNDGRVPFALLTARGLPAQVGVACPICDDGSMVPA